MYVWQQACPINLMASASLAIEIGVVYFPHLKGNTATRFKYASCLLSSYNSVSVLIDKVWKYLPKITENFIHKYDKFFHLSVYQYFSPFGIATHLYIYVSWLLLPMEISYI